MSDSSLFIYLTLIDIHFTHPLIVLPFPKISDYGREALLSPFYSRVVARV